MFQPSDLPSLQSRTFIVTGGNTGIGYMTCLELAAHGAQVFMGARSEFKANQAINDIKKLHPKADLHVLLLDHTRLSSVVDAAHRFIAQEKQLHGLILNAGIMGVPYEVTPDGFESQLQVNYLAHWVLTSHLMPVLLSTARATGPGGVRIVYVSSEGHKSFGTKRMLYDSEEVKNFGMYGRYGLSKLANVLHAKTLNDEYGPGSTSSTEKAEIWTASLHPGFINTQLNEVNHQNAPVMLAWLYWVLLWTGIMRPREEGCLSNLYVAASPDFTAKMSGLYLDHKTKPSTPNPIVGDVEERKKLEKWTQEQMTAGGWAPEKSN